MHADSKLVSIGSFDLKPRHLLIIAILSISFTLAYVIRAQPAQYGFELNEFDPFFNYRATLYMVENGIPAYYEWHDYMSWYPNGRDVSATSQVVLHLTAAITYQVFGGGMSLYDYTIIFPAVFASLTAIVIFALVRVIGGTSAGLFAALLYSVSFPILVRSPIGWFKSEPFGLFLSILAAYLLVSGLYSSERRWIAVVKMISAGFFVSASISAWGGNQFFVIVIGIFFLALPFLRSDHKFLIWAVPLFAVSTLISSMLFERGLASTPLAAVAIGVATAFLVACIFIQKRSTRHKTRNGLILLGALLVIAPAFAIVNTEADIIPIPSYRYLNTLNPFMTTADPLVESVSEHATTTLEQSFFFHSVLMLFAGIGIWLVIKAVSEWKINIRLDMFVFALILGMVGVYVSSAYVRMEIFAGVAVIILASLGLSILSKEFFGRGTRSSLEHVMRQSNVDDVNKHIRDENKDDQDSKIDDLATENTSKKVPATRAARAKSAKMQRRAMHTAASLDRTTEQGVVTHQRRVKSILSIPFMVGIVVILLAPLAYPGIGTADLVTIADVPPTILTGGSSLGVPTNDWLDTFEWMKNSTSPDSVIASWWDYGYWISTLGERASIADNATIDSNKIESIADMFLSTPDEAWHKLREMQADYVLVFVAGQMLQSDSPMPLYLLQHGGDESKKQWFMRIAGHNLVQYLESDGMTGTDYFWDSTALGKFFPFSVVSYLNPMNTTQQFPVYVPGAVTIYTKEIKYPADGDGPFRLAYSSPSFVNEQAEPMHGIFIYEINADYIPAGSSTESTDVLSSVNGTDGTNVLTP